MIVSSCLYILMQTHAISIYRDSFDKTKSRPQISYNKLKSFLKDPQIIIFMHLYFHKIFMEPISILWKLSCIKMRMHLKELISPQCSVYRIINDLNFKSMQVQRQAAGVFIYYFMKIWGERLLNRHH